MAGGRPSKYQTHVEPKLLLVAKWARNGLTDKDIAEKLDISVDSMVEYKKQFPELSESLKVNKEEADTRVENMLYKRAMGYQYEEITIEQIELKMGSGENVMYQPATKTKTVIKEVVPDTTAQIFWLKNRDQRNWRDKQDIEHSGQMTNKIDLSGLSVEDLKAYAKTKQSAT
jgi:hypothetical protein